MRLAELDLSEAEACRIAGLKPHQIKTIRMGNMPRPSVLVRLSKALRIPAVELLYAAVEEDVPEWERIGMDLVMDTREESGGGDGYDLMLTVAERVLAIAVDETVSRTEIARCIALTHRRAVTLGRPADVADVDLIAMTVLDTLKAR